MNSDYLGITAESLMLLSENRFRNSKAFYDENKEKLKKGIVIPMRQIAGALSEKMYELDENMMLDPTKMVSRIRRDTRFTNDKTLYRENIWILFMRPKHDLPYYPAMWFEISPSGCSGGVGTYATPPKMMETYRRMINENKVEFLAAAKSCESAGCSFFGERFKTEKPGCTDERLKSYYNVKGLAFMFKFSDVSRLENAEFLKDIEMVYDACAPMYRFLLKVSQRYAEENL